MADGVIIDRGRALRLASPNLRDALLVRDQGCRFPHCDTPAAWVHAHHLQHWENEGPTDLANLTRPKYYPFAASMDQKRRGSCWRGTRTPPQPITHGVTLRRPGA